MLRHYLASTLANIARTPFTTAANILTLALGLACFIAAFGISAYWTSADSSHSGANRIVVIQTEARSAATAGSSTVKSRMSTPIRLAMDLRSEMPELEAVARTSESGGEVPVQAGSNTVFLTTVGADRAILDLFTFEFVEGCADTALRAANDVVLTEDAARRVFGDSGALGKSLIFAGVVDARVSGVIRPVRHA
ncbi:MAG: hypothetical protein EON93_07820 [Burkholderiales bacterium]|nr:MAG: hypothetical protein EON93_07820 [Burkholderiales bacterium]